MQNLNTFVCCRVLEQYPEAREWHDAALDESASDLWPVFQHIRMHLVGLGVIDVESRGGSLSFNEWWVLTAFGRRLFLQLSGPPDNIEPA